MGTLNTDHCCRWISLGTTCSMRTGPTRSTSRRINSEAASRACASSRHSCCIAWCTRGFNSPQLFVSDPQHVDMTLPGAANSDTMILHNGATNGYVLSTAVNGTSETSIILCPGSAPLIPHRAMRPWSFNLQRLMSQGRQINVPLDINTH